MAESKTLRLNKVLRELNISLDRAVEYLASKKFDIEARPTTKISSEVYEVLLDGFQTDKSKRKASEEVGEEKKLELETLRLAQEEAKQNSKKEDTLIRAKSAQKLKVTEIGKIELNTLKNPIKNTKTEEIKPEAVTVKPEKPTAKAPTEAKNTEAPASETPDAPPPATEEPKIEIPTTADSKTEKTAETPEVKSKKETTEAKPSDNTNEHETPSNGDKKNNLIQTKYQKLEGPKLTGGKIDLSKLERPKKKRRRITKPEPAKKPQASNTRSNKPKKGKTSHVKEEPTDAEVQKQIRETLEKLQKKSNKGTGARHRREKRDLHKQQSEEDLKQQEEESNILRVTEFVTAGEFASLMEVPVGEVISACMSLGMMVTMNQRLDAETLSIVAEEFNFKIEFIRSEAEELIEEEIDDPKSLKNRGPIVTVMGHVDHGKTSLLDYIRKTNVIAGESGGITQHIGAYSVTLESGQHITFLDTPGHEAFTAMRARGTQVTDLAIIVIAADDDIMPQTKEAISHAQAASVPIVFAINKIDKQGANPDKIKEQLAAMNLLVEDWGGKIQSHNISAKEGTGVDELLEKTLLEAELLELKANPDKAASGTVVEALLDKGRGYVSTVLVQAGTLKKGDYILAGMHSGKIKAMFDERGHNLQSAGPSMPVSILGLDGAPQAGDKFNVFSDEREAKQIASKRSQLQREQSVRTQKHITLDEIGRRIALGDFKELNIILKGDVDGSVEALTDSLQKLSTNEIHVNILHKAVGAITESDVLLASASDAIIVGFNVRPTGNARSIADKEEVDIRMYSIIYAAIEELKDAMEGMLSPEMKEEVTGNVEIREIYKISKVGNIAGCMVVNGKIFSNSLIRIIREGIVVHSGELDALKRFKDDAKEVGKGFECGVQIKNFNDIKQGDLIEAYKEVAVKKKLK